MRFPSIPAEGNYLTNYLTLDRKNYSFYSPSRGNFNVKCNASSRITIVRLCCILKG